MALNNIQLNSSLLVQMYRSSLIETANGQEFKEKIVSGPGAEKKDINNEWKYLGHYEKNILMIVRYNSATYLPDEQLNFLTSVLGACKLSLADVAVLNSSTAPSALFKDVQEKFKSSITILFGLTPQEFEMPMDFPQFQVQSFNNCTFVHTPPLEQLESDKVLKSKLWVCFRRLFNV